MEILYVKLSQQARGQQERLPNGNSRRAIHWAFPTSTTKSDDPQNNLSSLLLSLSHTPRFILSCVDSIFALREIYKDALYLVIKNEQMKKSVSSQLT